MCNIWMWRNWGSDTEKRTTMSWAAEIQWSAKVCETIWVVNTVKDKCKDFWQGSFLILLCMLRPCRTNFICQNNIWFRILLSWCYDIRYMYTKKISIFLLEFCDYYYHHERNSHQSRPAARREKSRFLLASCWFVETFAMCIGPCVVTISYLGCSFWVHTPVALIVSISLVTSVVGNSAS